ncbi:MULTISPECIES: hypothetical protein [Spirulina sp. CCY15215]|nr:hypothetical protein [Spirulina major]
MFFVKIFVSGNFAAIAKLRSNPLIDVNFGDDVEVGLRECDRSNSYTLV